MTQPDSPTATIDAPAPSPVDATAVVAAPTPTPTPATELAAAPVDVPPVVTEPTAPLEVVTQDGTPTTVDVTPTPTPAPDVPAPAVTLLTAADAITPTAPAVVQATGTVADAFDAIPEHGPFIALTDAVQKQESNARAALVALNGYATATGLTGDDVITVIIDLLTDLHHLAALVTPLASGDQYALVDAFESARDRFDDEVEGA